MATVTLTTENFEDVTTQDGIVLIDFWASWCGPCRMFAPVVERASQRHPDIVFGKVDIDEQVALARAFDISSIPTVMVVRDGVLQYSRPGALSEAMLNELIVEARGGDMETVRGSNSRTS